MPAVIFTDGACEGEGRNEVTIGGLIVDPTSGPMECFGLAVPPALVAVWKEGGREQVIGQAEILPVFVAEATWGWRLRGRRVVHYVDNESAKFALIKGTSPQEVSSTILDAFWTLEAKLGTSSWFDRVRSESNPADAPSRLDFECCSQLGVTRVEAKLKLSVLMAARW